jgi:hypothetical protein
MKMLVAKPEGKRLDRPVHTGIDQTKTGTNPAGETKNHTQFVRKIFKSRHSVSKGLDWPDAQRQHGG